MRRVWMVLGLGVSLAAAGPARGDVWDVQTSSDNTPAGTQNELVHGSDQIHDLGALPGPLSDEDWYRITFDAQASCSYNPNITVSGTGVKIQVFRSCQSATIACGANNSGAAAGWNTWEFTYAGGTANCGNNLPIDPTPATGAFINTTQIPNPTTLYVRVFATGAPNTCLSYTLTATT